MAIYRAIDHLKNQYYFSQNNNDLQTHKFYHYTDLSSCLNILKPHYFEIDSKKIYNVLWVSQFLYLNDEYEFREGFEVFLELLKQKINEYPFEDEIKNNFKKFLALFDAQKQDSFLEIYFKACEKSIKDDFDLIYPNYFIMSFCEDGNLLSQWKYYGKDSGIALEFDLKNCLFSGNNINCGNDVFSKPLIKSVEYDKEHQINKIKTIIDEFIEKDKNKNEETDLLYESKMFIMKVLVELAFMKNSGFREEKESRLIFPLVYNGFSQKQEEALKLIKYRESKGSIKPYLNIKVSSETLFPIKSITVGPGENQIKVFHALISFVQSNYPYNAKLTDLTYNKDNDDFESVMVNGIIIRRSLIPFKA